MHADKTVSCSNESLKRDLLRIAQDRIAGNVDEANGLVLA